MSVRIGKLISAETEATIEIKAVLRIQCLGSIERFKIIVEKCQFDRKLPMRWNSFGALTAELCKGDPFDFIVTDGVTGEVLLIYFGGEYFAFEIERQ